jgi:hypothetical protein
LEYGEIMVTPATRCKWFTLETGRLAGSLLNKGGKIWMALLKISRMRGSVEGRHIITDSFTKEGDEDHYRSLLDRRLCHHCRIRLHHLLIFIVVVLRLFAVIITSTSTKAPIEEAASKKSANYIDLLLRPSSHSHRCFVCSTGTSCK